MDYSDIIDALEGELLDLNEQVNNIQAKADGEGRDLTEDETTEVESLMAQFDGKTEEIGRRKRMQAQADKLREGMGRQTDPDDPPAGVQAQHRPSAPARPRSEDSGKWGWQSFGQFAAAVRTASAPSGGIDPRLVANAPTTYSTEGVGEDGGFAVPPDFRTTIMEKVMGEESLLSRTDNMTTPSNSVTFPADETTPWDSVGGIQAYWGAEAAKMNQSKIALKEKQIRLEKLYVLVPVTEELYEDWGTLDAYLRRKVPQKFDYKIQNAIVRGTGVGQMTGILNAPCTVSVAKDTSTSPVQPADTLRYINILNMWSRMYAPCRSRSIWLINQDIEPQLHQMQFKENTNTPVPVYLPPGGVSSSPYGSLMGRPVVPVQSCSTLGDKGDIIFSDLSQYLSLTKVGGIRSDISIHLFFDYDQVAFKFVFRVAGMPWWESAIVPANSPSPALTQSCFVTLDERA